MFWGDFSWKCTTSPGEISTRIDSQGYTDILEEKLLPCASKIAGRGWIFQQDNAAIHTSKHTNGWFNRKKMRMLGWPAKSPDLNPIENFWGIMARQVYGHGRQYNTKSELISAIIHAWNNLSLDLLQNLISSMKNRIFKVINGSGSFTK